MNICRICKCPIMDNGYLHEYSFGGTLKIEETHSGICAEEFDSILNEVLTEDCTDDPKIINESLDDVLDGYQIL